MAKAQAKSGGLAKVRLVILEAELPDGDIAQLSQALQNALRPQPQVHAKLIGQSSSPPDSAGASEDEVLDDDEHDLVVQSASQTQSPRKPRVAKTPTVLDDLDVKKEPSLAEFTGQFDIKTNVDKYLVIALWLRDARGIDTFNVDHIYTCFRILSWSTKSTDFSKPLRNLRDEQSLKGGAKDGFSLSLTGAGKIEEKKRSSQ